MANETAATRPELPPACLDGWYALHQLFRVRDQARKPESEAGRTFATELSRWLAANETAGDHGWSGAYRTVGGNGTDLLLLHFRSDLPALGEAQDAVRCAPFSADLELVHDYVSVVELGLYALTASLAEARGDDPRDDLDAWDEALAEAMAEQSQSEYVRRRLYPVQPDDMPFVCYYPMSKRRDAVQNWYRLGLAERAEMMNEHGSVGRRYAGRISQVISGSVGLDDWEWAVTLFARDPLDFKGVVTDMRYDRVSAEYVEFGPFYVGVRVEADDVSNWWLGGGGAG